jgi:hypothetical protein
MTPEGMIISTLMSIIMVSKLLLANTLRMAKFCFSVGSSENA